MSFSRQTASHPVLDELNDALTSAVTTLDQKSQDTTVCFVPARSSAKPAAERAYRIEGLDDGSLQVRFAVYPLGDGTHEVYLDLEEGPTCRFTYDATGTRSHVGDEKERLGRKVRAVLLREIEARLDRTSGTSGSEAVSAPSNPILVLDRDGAIQRVNDRALEVLEFATEETIDPNFFTHVHGQNLPRVMRDLAGMVNGDVERARWILRLRTGSDRWRWYRAEVMNRLDAHGTIQIDLL